MTIKIHDDAALLSSSDRSAIESAASSWRFDTHLLIRVVPGTGELDDAAHAAITAPGVVVIAIDPTHHHTAVRFGTATRVKPADYDSIAKAGNAHFRAGEWGAGIAAIGTRAEASAEAKVAMAVSNEPVVIEQGLSTGAWVGISLLFAAIVGVIVLVVRRMRRNEERFASAASDLVLETSGHRSRNENLDAGRDFDARLGRSSAARAQPAYCPPVSTVVIDRGGGNDLLTGVLLGEAMSDRHSAREVVYEERSSSRDDGGSSSSWDSSSSSDDSGGSSSSWDSGSDSGGGGDSGGGDSGW